MEHAEEIARTLRALSREGEAVERSRCESTSPRLLDLLDLLDSGDKA